MDHPNKDENRQLGKLDIHILSLFPGYFKGPFDESIIKKATQKGLVDIHLVDIRDYSKDRFRRVDDRPYGGGPGMVLSPQPVVDAVRDVKKDGSHIVYLSPQGRLLTAAKARELSQYSHLIFLCGHYEGIDQRAIDMVVDEEISIGDYVLTNGCIAAIVVIDALLRFVDGVLGNPLTTTFESFENGVLDHPHYTRPENFEGQQVPDVLLSGDHSKIALWRRQEALKKTKCVRPDLYSNNIGKQVKLM